MIWTTSRSEFRHWPWCRLALVQIGLGAERFGIGRMRAATPIRRRCFSSLVCAGSQSTRTLLPFGEGASMARPPLRVSRSFSRSLALGPGVLPGHSHLAPSTAAGGLQNAGVAALRNRSVVVSKTRGDRAIGQCGNRNLRFKRCAVLRFQSVTSQRDRRSSFRSRICKSFVVSCALCTAHLRERCSFRQ